MKPQCLHRIKAKSPFVMDQHGNEWGIPMAQGTPPKIPMSVLCPLDVMGILESNSNAVHCSRGYATQTMPRITAD